MTSLGPAPGPFYMDQFEWTWTVCEHIGAGLQIGKASSEEEIRSKVQRLGSAWMRLEQLKGVVGLVVEMWKKVEKQDFDFPSDRS